MATKTRKPAPARSKASQPRQSKPVADAATAERSKDAKPSFGKAAPRKVVAGAAHKVAAKAAKPHKPAAASKSGPIRTVASVATGAVVATARLAASMFGRRAKAKAK